MGYDHTQKSPLDDLLFAVAGAALICAWAFRHEPLMIVFLILFAGIFLLLGLSFGHLTIRDEGQYLELRYGPLPVFHKRIPYSAITAVEPGRSSIIDGWGIHYVPGRGWTYNLWGFDCVKLSQGTHVVRIGSDDVPNLASFLHTRTDQR
jgi:hypothetical protein